MVFNITFTFTALTDVTDLQVTRADAKRTDLDVCVSVPVSENGVCHGILI